MWPADHILARLQFEMGAHLLGHLEIEPLSVEKRAEFTEQFHRNGWFPTRTATPPSARSSSRAARENNRRSPNSTGGEMPRRPARPDRPAQFRTRCSAGRA